MARPKVTQLIPDLKLSSGVEALLLGLGEAQIGTKERMILLAIDQIVERGPVDFNSGLVCDQLGIKHPMIKHYFGSKENLLSEALLWSFRDWHRVLTDSLKTSSKNPEEILKRRIKAEVEWGRSMKAMAILSHYPMVSENARRIISVSHATEMQSLFEFHLATLTEIVICIRAKKPFTISFDVSNYPRKELALKQPKAFLAAGSISWATHGLVIWSSGDHLSTRGFAKETAQGLSAQIAINSHIKNIIKIAKG